MQVHFAVALLLVAVARAARFRATPPFGWWCDNSPGKYYELQERTDGKCDCGCADGCNTVECKSRPDCDCSDEECGPGQVQCGPGKCVTEDSVDANNCPFYCTLYEKHATQQCKQGMQRRVQHAMNVIKANKGNTDAWEQHAKQLLKYRDVCEASKRCTARTMQLFKEAQSIVDGTHVDLLVMKKGGFVSNPFTGPVTPLDLTKEA